MHMRKYSFAPVVFLIAGAVGAVLKHFELEAVIDPETGYANAGAPISLAIWMLILAALVSAILFAVRFVPVMKKDRAADKLLIKRAKRLKKEKQEAVRRGGRAEDVEDDAKVLDIRFSRACAMEYSGLALSFCAGIAVAAASVLAASLSSVSGTYETVLRALGVLTGLSLIALGYAAYKGRDGFAVPPASVIPAFFCVLQLADIYRRGGMGMPLVSYAAGALGIGFAGLALINYAGYAFRNRNGRATLWTALAACFSLVLAQGEDISLAHRVIYAGLAIFIAAVTAAYIRTDAEPELVREAEEERARLAAAESETEKAV